MGGRSKSFGSIMDSLKGNRGQKQKNIGFVSKVANAVSPKMAKELGIRPESGGLASNIAKGAMRAKGGKGKAETIEFAKNVATIITEELKPSGRIPETPLTGAVQAIADAKSGRGKIGKLFGGKGKPTDILDSDLAKAVGFKEPKQPLSGLALGNQRAKDRIAGFKNHAQD